MTSLQFKCIIEVVLLVFIFFLYEVTLLFFYYDKLFIGTSQQGAK